MHRECDRKMVKNRTPWIIAQFQFLKSIERNWSELVGNDQQWLALRHISDQCLNFDWYRSTLIGIGQWLRESYKGHRNIATLNMCIPSRGGMINLTLWYITNRILAPCNYCHHPWCVGHKSYHKAQLIMFGCDGISDHASLNEVLHYGDTKLSWQQYYYYSFYFIVPALTHLFDIMEG